MDNLKSFLNAVLKTEDDEKLEEVEIINEKELTTDNIQDKKGIIDVLAKTKDGTHINIEVQLTNQDNMDKRTLFYWSRIFNRGIVKGEDYSNLNKVITINILDFNYIELEKYHTTFTLRENENTEYKLTDVLELHFIEMPKFKKVENKNLEQDKLQRWLMFLRNDISQSELEVLISMDKDIRVAEEKLEYLSSDPVTQELYFERERALHEKANLINTGIRKGIEQGIQQGIQQNKVDTIIRFNSMGITVEQIAQGVELTIEEVKEILSKHLN
ncbi:MAG: Rpn family recombination-promoting nuclease/putative transposase [Paraclostridium sp.]